MECHPALRVFRWIAAHLGLPRDGGILSRITAPVGPARSDDDTDRDPMLETARGRVLAPVLLAVIMLALWEAAVRLGAVNPFFLPQPLAILQRVVDDVTGPNLAYAWPTLTAAAAGSLLALVVAMPLGVLIAHSTTARVTLEPSIAASQALPAVAVAPLLVLWLGYGLAPVVVLCALMVFFPILVATTHALASLDPDLIGAARLDGAARWSMLTAIKLPLALPAILTGIRNGFTISITGAIVGEIVTGGRGLGLLLSARAASADTVGIFSTLVLLCAVAIAVYATIGAAARRLAQH